jgi:beta-lactamase regulating signal transducer with metallopeptidase domain
LAIGLIHLVVIAVSRSLSFKFFFPGLKSVLSEKQISLINYFKIEGFDPIFSSIFIAFCLVTSFYLLRKIYHIFFIYKSLRKIEIEGVYYEGEIKNPVLKEALSKSGVRLMIHEELTMPMTAYKNLIYIPANLDQTLSQEEFEAVIAHELEHIRNKDVFFKTVCQFIVTLAWWIPTQSRLQRLDHDIELSCDQGAAKYKTRYNRMLCLG